MRTVRILATIAAVALPSSAMATTIAEGETLNFDVLGTASVYQIFGHSGGSGPAATDAILTTFASGSANVFTFAASGEIGCCSSIVTRQRPRPKPHSTCSRAIRRGSS